MSESLTFDLTLAEVSVTLGDRLYLLREADGETTVLYRNMLTAATDIADGKVVKVRNIADVEPFLVSRCLFQVNDDGTTTRVSEKFVRGLPSRVLRALYDRAKAISELDEDAKTAKESAKNAPAAATDGSA